MGSIDASSAAALQADLGYLASDFMLNASIDADTVEKGKSDEFANNSIANADGSQSFSDYPEEMAFFHDKMLNSPPEAQWQSDDRSFSDLEELLFTPMLSPTNSAALSLMEASFKNPPGSAPAKPAAPPVPENADIPEMDLMPGITRSATADVMQKPLSGQNTQAFFIDTNDLENDEFDSVRPLYRCATEGSVYRDSINNRLMPSTLIHPEGASVDMLQGGNLQTKLPQMDSNAYLPAQQATNFLRLSHRSSQIQDAAQYISINHKCDHDRPHHIQQQHARYHNWRASHTPGSSDSGNGLMAHTTFSPYMNTATNEIRRVQSHKQPSKGSNSNLPRISPNIPAVKLPMNASDTKSAAVLDEKSMKEVDVAANLLTNRSNYQNIKDNRFESMGVTYPGSMVISDNTQKRSVHKIAEQRRRNLFRIALDELKALLNDASMEDLDSKIAVIKAASKHIKTLNERITNLEIQMDRKSEMKC